MLASKKRLVDALCLSRLPLGVAFLIIYSPFDVARFAAAMGIAVIAFLTDVADGWFARRWGIASDAGAILDGLGDKGFYVAVYFAIFQYHSIDILLLWALVTREILLYGFRVIDVQRATTTKRLRSMSLAFAALIRVYFLAVFIEGACIALDLPPPRILRFSSVIAYLALLIGLFGLWLTQLSLAQDLER